MDANAPMSSSEEQERQRRQQALSALASRYSVGDGFQNAAPQAVARVTLYDTKTGQRLATLTSKRSVACAYTSDRPLLAWSPSGQQLALRDFCSGSITVWGAGYLDAPRP